MKVSEITDEIIRDYLVVDDDEEVSRLKSSAIAYIKSYTDMTDEEINENEELTECVLSLCSHFYDSRDTIESSRYINQVVDTILNLHRKNFV